MSSSAPRPGSCGDGGGGGRRGEEGAKENAVSKAAGFVVFSGIAMNIIKALTPKLPQQPPTPPSLQPTPLPPQPSPPPPLHAASAAKPPTREEETCRSAEPPKVPQIIEIVQGDTLWGLSRKYGVPISEIKKANGLTGDTIYAGKKLIIP